MHVVQKSVPDPDLEIRGEGWGGGGRGSGRSTRPLDKLGEPRLQKDFFPPFGPQFGSATEKYPPNLTKLN